MPAGNNHRVVWGIVWTQSGSGCPQKVRMGKGKGAPEFWVAVVKPGTVIFEAEGVPENIAREALRLAAQKLSVNTKFVIRRDYAAAQ